MENILVYVIDDRVIVYRVQFIHQHFFCIKNGIINRPQYLRYTTQGIILLHLVFKNLLLNIAGLTYADLDAFIVAGAFGTYLDLRSAVRTGMFPPLPLDRFHQVGNAAGVGAKQMLLSVDKRHEAEQLADQIGYIELTGQAAFTPLFMQYLLFEV